MTGAVVAYLPDGRLHLQHGPIDLICQAWGEAAAVQQAYRCASHRFCTVLTELVADLPELRREGGQPRGVIGARMARAVLPFRPVFITAMAAVAGSVAEEILTELAGPGICRAYANNGGDIALYLTRGQSLTCAIAAPGARPVTVSADSVVRGIATSGWRGRSWSLGIADAVTVLARTAAMADAAATMIANAVDLPGHPAITRRPANALQADTDLGARLVTTGVAPLTEAEVARALSRGLVTAESFRARGLIEAAALFLQGENRATGPLFVPHILLPKREAAHV
jgi:uncharacterized protein